MSERVERQLKPRVASETPELDEKEASGWVLVALSLSV
jgi:hypothetical protein